MSGTVLRRGSLALGAAAALAIVPVGGAFAAPSPAVAFIGAHGFPTVQAALDASRDGDTVTVAPGTFPGGIAVTKSITLRGAGAGRTVFRGGEHVITVGTLTAPAGGAPRVTIAGVTVTGGAAHSDAWGNDFAAEGAGIYALPDSENGGGSVTLVDTVVTANRADPVALSPGDPIGDDLSQYAWDDGDGFLRGLVCPDHKFCDYASAAGAGIGSYGDLTLVRSAVTNNTSAGVLTSDAIGGGIMMWEPGSALNATDSHVDGNSALASAPKGRYAEGGGIFAAAEVVVKLARTTLNGNSARITTTFPMDYGDYASEFLPLYTNTSANGAGIHLDSGASLELKASHADRNTLSSDAPRSQFGALNAAIQGFNMAHFAMTDSTADYNTVDVRLLDGQYVGAWGGIVQWDGNGTVTRSSISHNIQTVTALDGLAWANAAALGLLNGDGSATTIAGSTIADNRITLKSPHGGGVIAGVGYVSDATTTLVATKVTGNVGIALTAAEATTRLLGGGISNGGDDLYPGYANPDAKLTLTDSTVTANSLTSTARGAEIAGAGIHSLSPVTLTRSTVRGNAPDDCDACPGAAPGHGHGHPSPHPHWPWRVDHNPHEWGHHSR